MLPGRKRHRDCPSKRKDKNSSETKRRKVIASNNCNIPKLTDICARHVAGNFPYQQVEESLRQIPEPIQERIIFWAFPREEKDIALYSSTNSHFACNDQQKQPFQLGIKLFESGNVSDVLQVGFHLSGTVQETQGICLQRKVFHYKVSLKFDRCKITSVLCTCNNRTILWCSHAVALAVYRIRHANQVKIRVPVSEAILQLKATQLQSLLLHVITQHHQDILPTVQSLLDDLKRPNSEINRTDGFPDPTAGACSGSDSLWYLDSELIKEEVKTGLEPNNTGKNINSLLNKVREMFLSGDSNAGQLLTLITDSFMDSLSSILEEPARITDKARKLWDCLSLVWLCASLNPRISSEEKRELQKQLTTWDRQQKQCRQDANVTGDADAVFSCFEMPLSAIKWTYSLSEDDVIRAAAFADAFRCHGFHQEAVRIATKIGERFQRSLLSELEDNTLDSTQPENSWLGHNIDPISIIFDILSAELEKNKRKGRYSQLALYVAFVGLGQLKALPNGRYEQLRLCHREEQLIAQLEDFDFSSEYLKPVICQFCKYLQKKTNHNYGVSPSHSFTRFLFNKVLPLNKELAYNFSMPLIALSPSLDSSNELQEDVATTTCHILSHLEAQQSELAANLLRGCCDNTNHITSVVASIKTNIRNPSQLYRLAKLASSLIEDNCEQISSRVETELQKAAIELGTKAVQLTLNTNSWDRHEMVRWLVSTSVLRGKQAVFALFLRWRSLFSAEEVSKEVATMLSSHAVLYKLHMDKDEERNFMSHLRSVVIESAIHDPSSCALFALTLCECEPEAFDLACQIVNESANRLSTTQLFSIARFLEGKGYLHKGLKVATLALKQLDIGLEQETHPAVCDVFWACALACSLGKDELTQLTPILCNCIRNPVILTEIARRSVRTSNYVINNGSAKTKHKLHLNKEPVNRLLATAQQLFIQEVQNKLNNISPKQYTNFVLYLGKVKSGFDLVDEGHEQFQWLLDFIATSQKGRKKLQKIINDTFLESKLKNSFYQR